MASDRKVAWSVFGFERMVAGGDALDPHLKSCAVMASAAVIGWENERSRVNSAAGLASQGYSDVCELSLAGTGTDVGR